MLTSHRPQAINTAPVIDALQIWASWWNGAIQLAWVIVAAVITAVIAGCVAFHFEYATWAVIASRIASVAAILTCAVLLNEKGWVRASVLMECLALSTATALSVPALTSMIAALGVPYQDGMLLAADRALGFDWPRIVEWFGARQQLSVVLSHVYSSLLWQPMLLLPMLAFFDPARLRRVLAASTVALLITVAVFAFAPAETGYVHLGYVHEQFPGLLANTGWGVADILETLRAGDRHLSLEGLITFPSFHAVAAVLFVYAWSAVPGLRYPMIVLNLAMLVSCVPIGSHYVVDVLGGLMLAIAALAAVARRDAKTSAKIAFVDWQHIAEGEALIGVQRWIRTACAAQVKKGTAGLARLQMVR